ncbi:MAG: hypothetical protein E7606_01035 [Ruminococcaceae bacterium]|nr:hypothetical protein [Oscillospiraceae bacterium]
MKKKILYGRYLALLGFFACLCLIFVIRLASFQFFGDNEEMYREYDVKNFTYTVTIPALRGDICDRDGKIITTTKQAYALAFDYWSMPVDKEEANRSILVSLEALRETDAEDKRTEDYFPFDGQYPDLKWKGEAKTEGTTLYSRLHRVMGRRNFKEDMTDEEMVTWYAKKFGLLDSKGEPLYTNEEMTELLRVRYNMDAVDFGTFVQYHLADDVSLETVAYVKEKNALGMVFPRSTERQYNYPGYLSHILGSTGEITANTLAYYTELGYPADAIVGTSGIEQLFEEYLHGTDGEMTVVEDKNGYIIDSYVSREPIPGKDVWLSIDIDLQVAAEDALAEYVERYSENDSAGGAFVAIDPKTNGVLVMASYPTYDLMTFNKEYNKLLADPAIPLLNRALNGVYTPGSTFKLGTAAAALEENKITTSSQVNCVGYYTLGNYKMKCWVHPDSHGYENVVDAITHSCNVFFAEMGDRLGIDVMNRYSKAFGLGQATGIELSESLGNLAGEESRLENGGGAWYPADTVMAAIGQSDNAFTPLQICNYVTTLMRGGTRYEVHILDSVREYYTDEILYSRTPNVLGQISLSKQTVSTVMEGMKNMVSESATATYLFEDIPVTVGGKTGTAQVGTDNDNGLFVCTAPYNAPEIISACVIEGSNTGRYSEGVAAAVLEAYYGVND